MINGDIAMLANDRNRIKNMLKINNWNPFSKNPLGIALFSFFLTFQSVFSQNALELSLQILGPSFLLDINFEQSVFLEWGKNFKSVLENSFQEKEENRNALLMVTIFPHSPPLFEISAKPAYSSEQAQKILEQLQSCPPPQAKWTETSILFSLKMNKGNNQTELEFLPKVETPLEKRKQKFQKLPVEAQYHALKNWAKEEVLPVLTLHLENVAEDFEGLKNLSQKLQTVSWENSWPTGELTLFQKSYWQSLIEMEPGNQLIPAFQVFIDVAEGKLERAKRFLTVLRYFSNPEELPTYYLQELFWKLELFHFHFSEVLQQGRTLCLEKKYENAFQHYQRALLIYPHSASLYYEIFIVNQLLQKTPASLEKEMWKNTAQTLKNCDPFFAPVIEAENGEEAYFLYRCLEVSELFKDQEKLLEDFVEYANIALDIQEYAFSAHLYWICFIYFSEETENQHKILRRFFYCLSQLGHNGMQTMVEGINEAEVYAVGEERLFRMKKHPIYQKFQKKSSND